MREGELDDFSWVDAGGIQGAAEQLLEANYTVFAVQQHQCKYFVLIALQQDLQVTCVGING